MHRNIHIRCEESIAVAIQNVMSTNTVGSIVAVCKNILVITVVFFTTLGSASADLVVGYNFEYMDAGNVDDLSTNNLDGTLVGDATTVFDDTRNSNVLSLDGINDWVDAGNSELYNITGDMTVMGWAKMEDKDGIQPVNFSWQTLFAKGDANGWRVQHWAPGNNFAVFQWQLPSDPFVANANSTPTNLLDNWHHVAGVKAGNDYRIYIDGDLAATDVQTATPLTSTVPLLVGANPELGAIPANDDPWREMLGRMDDFALFDTALTEEEIEIIMDNGLGGGGSAPIPATLFTWKADVSGDWNNGDNWLPDTPTGAISPNGNQHTVIFSDVVGSNVRTVFIDQSVSVNSIRFENSMGGGYRVTGGPRIDLVATTAIPTELPSIHVLQGSHEFQAPVTIQADTTVDVAMGATMTFNNALNLSGLTLNKTGGGTMAINNLLSQGGGTLICDMGTCSGTGTIGGDMINEGGVISPGNSLDATANVGQVPEPGGIVLLSIGWLIGWSAIGRWLKPLVGKHL